MQGDWPSGNPEALGKTVTALEDAGTAALGARPLHSPLAPDLVTGSSESSSLDGEIASAGFGRAAEDDLREGSSPEAGLVQGEWSYSPTKLGPSDFELLRVVGQGAFGKVGPLPEELQYACAECHHGGCILCMPVALLMWKAARP